MAGSVKEGIEMVIQALKDDPSPEARFRVFVIMMFQKKGTNPRQWGQAEIVRHEMNGQQFADVAALARFGSAVDFSALPRIGSPGHRGAAAIPSWFDLGMRVMRGPFPAFTVAALALGENGNLNGALPAWATNDVVWAATRAFFIDRDGTGEQSVFIGRPGSIVDLGQPDRIGLGDSVVQVGAILASRVDADGNMIGDLFGFDPK